VHRVVTSSHLGTCGDHSFALQSDIIGEMKDFQRILLHGPWSET
jgi:hypothetical protein